jgi:hypothetical protein
VQLSDKEQTRRVERTLMVGMFIGMANVFLCAALIGDQTLPIFGVWSRANGFADTGEMMSAALLGQWAWIPLAAIFWRQWRAARKIVQGQ